MKAKFFVVPFFAGFVFFLGLAGCKPGKKAAATDTLVQASAATTDKFAYDLAHPVKLWSLPDELKEVSGLAQVDDSHFLVIEDLHPNLYLLNTAGASPVIEKTIPFQQTDKEKFDIEDVALHNDTAYALWSHGKIFRVSNWKAAPQTTEFKTPLKKEENTEGLCFDPLTGKLLVACKNASGLDDEKKSTHAVYSFNLQSGTLDEEPFLLIRKKDFEKTAGEKLDFFPSAVAVQPATNDVFLLSSRENKALAVYNRKGELKTFVALDKELLPQPEGLCFGRDGNLYISTQGRHGAPPKIYAFAKR